MSLSKESIWLSLSPQQFSGLLSSFRRSPPEQYSIARRGTSLIKKFNSSGTSQAFTTFAWSNFFMIWISWHHRSLFLELSSKRQDLIAILRSSSRCWYRLTFPKPPVPSRSRISQGPPAPGRSPGGRSMGRERQPPQATPPV